MSEEAEAIANLFATHAAIALGHAREREHLNEALQSRKLIGQAVGIVMERYSMNEDRAFDFLVRASSHGNIKLRQVAQELVDEINANSTTILSATQIFAATKPDRSALRTLIGARDSTAPPTASLSVGWCSA